VPLEVQKSLPVFYKGSLVGDYIADIVVADQVLVELKCVQRLKEEHTAQCINYLRASGLRLCLLINFQRPRLEWKRILL
jgi:GxxExxY protein